MRIYERERHKRYAKGTLVVATANFCAEKIQVREKEKLLLKILVLLQKILCKKLRFCSFFFDFKNGQNFPSDHAWGSKNRIGSKNSYM